MYKPIAYEGKIYTQLKKITGEVIYNVQLDKECKVFQEEFTGWVFEEGFFDNRALNELLIRHFTKQHPRWLPFLEQQGFIKIEDAESEPLPCPLPRCGGKAEIVAVFGDFWVNCTKCALQTDLFSTSQKAVDAWNGGRTE